MKTDNNSNNIAILDIGKTHAKVILFDANEMEELVVYQKKNEIVNNSIYPHFDIKNLKRFIISSLQKISKNFQVNSIFTSTHGACMALMTKGELALPVLDYEFEGPDQYRDEYNDIRPNFSQSGSPRMDSGLNLGAQLFWQSKNFPEKFAMVDQILFWPQFWSYWLSGIAASEISYASSHSDLWDIKKNKFINLNTFGIEPRVKYPPLMSASTVLGPLRKNLVNQTGLPENIPVFCGAHDSSLSLISASFHQSLPCTILSTGTWITIFALGSNNNDIEEQTGLMISCDCYGKLVPNFRFPAGKIYENLLNQANGYFDENFDINKMHIILKNFDNVEKASLIDTKLNKTIDPKNINKKTLEIIVSEVMANQTLSGMRTIEAEGPIICSGSFTNNKNFLKSIEKNWGNSIILEDNRLGICKGIANLISK
jgi:sugar (pentulose or hexulose) kinase